MKREFNDVIASLKGSIAPANFFVDFPKIYANITKHERNLHLMNSLLGKENIEQEFISLVTEYPKVMETIPLLLATHEKKFKIINLTQEELLTETKNKNYDSISNAFAEYSFNPVNKRPEEYIEFLNKSGLLDLLKNRNIKNLVDYVLGIEVGMDTNARKSRSGKIMELIVEEYIKNLNIEYYSQMKSKDIDRLFGTNLCSLGKATKKFDFVFKSKVDNTLIVMEVNYYATQGSKPNETAKSYIELNNKIKGLNGVRFVWITDGMGWKVSRDNLEDAYNEIEHLYIIQDLENDILENI